MLALPHRLTTIALSLSQAVVTAPLLIATPASAGSFQVSPIRIQMAPRERATALHLSNTGDQVLTLHAEVMRWTQDASGQDILEPSNDLVLSPPVIALPAGAQQVVRLARLVPANPGQTQSYRLIIRETAREGVATQAVGQVPVLLGMSLPVFLGPAQPIKQFACVPQATSDTGLALACTNEGNVFVRVLRAEMGPSSDPVAKFSGATYWLPGSLQRLDMRSRGHVAAGSYPLTVWFDDGQAASLSVTIP